MIHLGMSGQVLIQDDDAPAQKHLKVTLQLSEAYDDDGAALPSQLRFIDQRIFGGMQLSPVVRDAVGWEPWGQALWARGRDGSFPQPQVTLDRTRWSRWWMPNGSSAPCGGVELG